MLDHFFTVAILLLILLCGGIAKGAIDRIEKNIQADANEGLKDAKPNTQAPWYFSDCTELSRTCRAQERLSKVRKS